MKDMIWPARCIRTDNPILLSVLFGKAGICSKPNREVNKEEKGRKRGQERRVGECEREKKKESDNQRGKEKD